MPDSIPAPGTKAQFKIPALALIRSANRYNHKMFCGSAQKQHMIVFELVCTHQHRFEGWFASAEDFDRQCRDGLLGCPVCADPKIEKLPSARIGGFAAATPAASESSAGMAVDARTRLSELRDAIIARTEDVGQRFAEEARRMHYDETPKRAIRGIATATETQELVEEGIEVLVLPILWREDLN